MSARWAMPLAGEVAAVAAALSFAAAWLAYVLAANADGAHYAGSRGSPLGPMWACAFGALAIANAAALRRAARAAISPLASPEDKEGGALKATSKEGAPLPPWGYGAAALAVAASAFLFSAFVGAAVAHEPHAAVWSAAACIAAVASVAAVLPPLRAARAASPARPRPCGCSRACCASACSCVYIWTTLVLSAVVLVGFGIQAPLAASEAVRFPPRGRRYLVPLQPGTNNSTASGLRMHIVCSGPRRSAAAPVLVMEHGGGGSGLDFAALQAATAALGFRSCAHDRAGAGYSDTPPLGRTSVAAARDRLAALLAAAGEAPPYIVLGHSVGVQMAQLFASQFPAQVAGLVLIDGYPDDVSDGATAAQRAANQRFVCALLQGARAFEAVALTRAISGANADFAPAAEAARKAALGGSGRAWLVQFDEFCRSPGPRLGDAVAALAPPGADPKVQRWPTLAQPALFLAAGATVGEGADVANVYWAAALQYNATLSSSPLRRLAVCAGCTHAMTWTHAAWLAAQINATFGALNV